MTKNTLYTHVWLPAMKHRGAGMDIAFGWHKSNVGDVLIAATPRGVCFVGFKLDNSKGAAQARLTATFPAATYMRDDALAARYGAQIDRAWSNGGHYACDIPLDLYGTTFQIKVWRALLDIPFGACTTYGDIARRIKSPNAARAVGSAVGANPVSIVVPCHRVLASTGVLGHYGWGPSVKQKLLYQEGVML